MIVGILREIKTAESRVSMTPAGVEAMVAHGHKVLVEQHAGRASGFDDQAYCDAGARILTSSAEIYRQAELVMHVKEPQPSEYELIRKGQVVFTYFHFAASEALTRAMIANRSVAIAYETITDVHGTLPLLTPMSEIAGRMATQQAAHYLERSSGGRGILLGGVPGVAPATVVILGAGVVGTNAAQMACGLGARVVLLDTSLARLRHLAEVMPKNCTLLLATAENIRQLLPEADAVIGAVLIEGGKAPMLIRRSQLALMKRGALLIDVAIDQGGCFETSRMTTHQEPVYDVDGILHYCVANMPGAVPLTSTIALTNATLPYALALADHGWAHRAKSDAGMRNGVNIAWGAVTHQAVAEAFGLPFTPVEAVVNTLLPSGG